MIRRFATLSALFLLSIPSLATVTPVGNQLWHLDSEGVPTLAGVLDFLGSATAAGDFDCNGYQDLAIGIPASDFFTVDDAGSVLVLYGTASGLEATDSQILRQQGDDEGLEEGDGFGSELATGDFDGNGCDDLAAGAPMDEVGGDLEAGTVSVFYGSADGLGDHEIWHQAVDGIAGAPEPDDRFGFALVAGDFDGDGRDDLAIGAPGDSVGGNAEAGLVNVIYGSVAGLTADGSQRLRQGFGGVEDVAEPDDLFGYALTSGDLDGDGRDELVVGVPGEGVSGAAAAGIVHVFPGTDAGLSPADDALWHQGIKGIADAVEAFDHFGLSLAAGDVNGDGRDDLAVGAPGQEVIGSEDGQLHLIFGSPAGLTGTGDLIVNKLTPGVVSVTDVEFFATELTAGDLDADGLADVVVGTPSQDVPLTGEDPVSNAGGVHVVHVAPGGALRAIEWVSLLTAIDVADGPPRTLDSFGSALAVGDFDDDGYGELAVGIPNRLVSGQPAAGAVVVLTSGLFGDGFESGDTARWSATTP